MGKVGRKSADEVAAAWHPPIDRQDTLIGFLPRAEPLIVEVEKPHRHTTWCFARKLHFYLALSFCPTITFDRKRPVLR
jgi:hypothetical protein